MLAVLSLNTNDAVMFVLTAYCDFEDSQMCGYDQSLGDQFDWTLRSGQTATLGSAPVNDHTYGTPQGKDMFNFLGKEYPFFRFLRI